MKDLSWDNYSLSYVADENKSGPIKLQQIHLFAYRIIWWLI
jgi:hypothetical protein